MSVWPSLSSTPSVALRGSEGELVSVSVTVEPRDLEDLLEALALLDFPVNPQIYHDAAVIWVDAGGGQRSEPVTIVEFPAYAERLQSIRRVLDSCGCGASQISISSMLDELHSNEHVEPGGPGQPCRILRKHATAAVGA